MNNNNNININLVGVEIWHSSNDKWIVEFYGGTLSINPYTYTHKNIIYTSHDSGRNLQEK